MKNEDGLIFFVYLRNQRQIQMSALRTGVVCQYVELRFKERLHQKLHFVPFPSLLKISETWFHKRARNNPQIKDMQFTFILTFRSSSRAEI